VKINLSLNGTPIELGDTDKLTRRIVGEAAVATIFRRLADIRDPTSGESVRITFTPTDDGVDVDIRGSEAVVRQATQRLTAVRSA